MQDSYYRLKHIHISKKQTIPLLLQNENGPCPLLAICNILFLTGKLHVHADYGGINNSDLLTMLSDYLSSLKPPPLIAADKGLLANYKQNVNDALKVLPKLSAGLDINVKFTGIKDMEFTQECIIFDVLNMNLVHGWIVDPQDASWKVVAKYSYDQLMEKLVERNALITRKCKEENRDTDELDLDVEATRLLPSLKGDERRVMKEGIAIQDYFLRTSTQLTYHGIVMLHQGLREGEFCVFFRNNHFSVLHKHNGSLFLLVTDVGYQDTPVVWEKLDQIDGDTILATHTFKIYQKSEEQHLIQSVAVSEAQPEITPEKLQEEDDFLLAQRLQEREMRRESALAHSRGGDGMSPARARKPAKNREPPPQAKAMRQYPRPKAPSRGEQDTGCVLS